MNEPTAKCEFCGSEKGKIYYYYTAERTLRPAEPVEPQANETEQELENTVSPYTNFKCHACSVCEKCRIKAKMKSALILFTIGIVSLVVFLIMRFTVGFYPIIAPIFSVIGLIGAPVALRFTYQDAALLVIKLEKLKDKRENICYMTQEEYEKHIKKYPSDAL